LSIGPEPQAFFPELQTLILLCGKEYILPYFLQNSSTEHALYATKPFHFASFHVIKYLFLGFEGEDVEVIGREGEVVLMAHGEGGPSLRLAEDTVTMDRIHDIRKDSIQIGYLNKYFRKANLLDVIEN
jgi:hypothetical protein